MAESKPRKTDEDNAIDRLSSLPDSLLFHILSFLPTKTCVSTITLISHKYLHLWKHLQVFEFYDDSQYPFEETELLKTFAAFVNSVLTLRKSRDIRKMRLSCAYSLSDTLYTNSFETWIRAAIGPYLEELHLFIIPFDGDQFPPPPSLFTCPNLVSLSFLFTALHKCPKLQALLIQNNMESKPKRKTPQPRRVPDCLISHLVVIWFNGFEGYVDEVRFAEYILRKGLVLKSMTIVNALMDPRQKDRVRKKLSDIPRGSAICKLQFDSDASP
ncbi:F-box/FBD/LRR-repeat protein [Trifolium medium]|uniref:F-box/FBD/LRR-repeat protein n=1 Tax=Trifolium medium TaxID=97028 RepID=A0A392M0N7_9FABA|nr:F-box/FBD/LRR-repeat protein [Trifolium medium]